MQLRKVNILLSPRLCRCMIKDGSVVFTTIAQAFKLPGVLCGKIDFPSDGRNQIDNFPNDGQFILILYREMVKESKRIEFFLDSESSKVIPFAISAEMRLFLDGHKVPFRTLRFGVGSGVIWYREG